VNRKGKKSSLTAKGGGAYKGRSKATTTAPGQPQAQRLTKAKGVPANAKRRGLFSKENFGVAGKSAKPQQKQTKAIADNNPRLKHSPKSQKSSPVRNSDKNSSRQAKKSRLSLQFAVYAITITVGLSTILGTVISIASSLQTAPDSKNTPVSTAVSSNQPNKTKLDSLFAIASLGKEIVSLKSSLQELANQYPDLQPEIFLVDLDTKGFVNIKGEEIIASASTIKLPVLVAFFQEVDRRKINLEEQLVMTKDVIAGGSGSMQYEKPGSKFSALETAEKMMINSDNTATNMLIKRLGGKEKLNRTFNKIGLKGTRLLNPLPDLMGTNTTTPEDLGNLLVKIDQGRLISLRSRDRLLYIMRNIVRNTLLPEGLGSGAIIAHKTGDIKSVLGDVGIIDMPSGKRYIASMLVKRPDNSLQAKEFIQKASSITYEYFQNPQTTSFNLEEE
jgi:beta-lactamase class A